MATAEFKAGVKRALIVVLNVLIWCALVAYCVFASRQCAERKEQETLGEVKIGIMDGDRLQVVTEPMVRQWLQDAGAPLEGTPLADVDTDRIRREIASRAFVRSVRVYTEQNGTLNIELTQRRPLMRIVAPGYDLYVSDDRWILPTDTDNGEYVPVVTGSFALPFPPGYTGVLTEREERETEGEIFSAESYVFLHKLINFVELTEADDFWRSEIVQINVRQKTNGPWKDPEIEIIPRVGRHIVAFGTPDGAREKLDKLMLFYRNVLDFEGWELYRRIDVRYKNQVVCRK